MKIQISLEEIAGLRRFGTIGKKMLETIVEEISKYMYFFSTEIYSLQQLTSAVTFGQTYYAYFFANSQNRRAFLKRGAFFVPYLFRKQHFNCDFYVKFVSQVRSPCSSLLPSHQWTSFSQRIQLRDIQFPLLDHSYETRHFFVVFFIFLWWLSVHMYVLDGWNCSVHSEKNNDMAL